MNGTSITGKQKTALQIISPKINESTAIFDRIIGLFRLFKNGFYRNWGRLLEQKSFGSYVYTVSEQGGLFKPQYV